MRTVYYRRPRAKFRRVLRPSDLDRLGVPHKGEVLVFDAGNNFSVEMTNRMSDSLVAALPDEFKALGEGDDDDVPEVKAPATSLNPSGKDKPEG